jgi:hypothetical protein
VLRGTGDILVTLDGLLLALGVVLGIDDTSNSSSADEESEIDGLWLFSSEPSCGISNLGKFHHPTPSKGVPLNN